MTLSARPNEAFNIPPLALSGIYSLRNIHVVRGTETLLVVTGGSFNNNARYGIEAVDTTSSTLPIANLWTDQEDYEPGSTVTISGNSNSLNGNIVGFIPGETILVQVQGPNGYTATCQATPTSCARSGSRSRSCPRFARSE